MIESLSKALIENELDPDAFAPVNDAIYRASLPVEGITKRWQSMLKASAQTRYWPILCDDSLDFSSAGNADANAFISRAPQGTLRELLRPRFEEMRQRLGGIASDLAEAPDMDRLAAMSDAAGIHAFIGSKTAPRPWPDATERKSRFSFNLTNKQQASPIGLLLIKVEHSSHVPAHLGFGGWNECPDPEFHVAVLREMRREYGAVPACFTGDTMECFTLRPLTTEAQAVKLAAEQWIYCDDIVGQGTMSIRNLAIELWMNRSWFFWWD